VLAAVATAGCSAEQVVTPSSQQAAAQPAAAQPTEQEIAALLDKWNGALATGDPQRVADLYAPDAVLLPTKSNEVRNHRAEIIDYLTKFLQSKPQGKIDREMISVVDPDTAINTGIYTFTLTEDGKQVQIHARYTYVYERINGKWLIVNHHSSVMPEGTTATRAH
jgi:uncharacterized protein (TIGR02246 family)